VRSCTRRLRRTWVKLLTCVFVCLATVASVSSGENVHQLSVRLLDGKSGKPISHIWITLAVPKGDKNANRWFDKTNSKGIVSFPLTEPIPESVWPLFGVDAELCFYETFSTEDILEIGVVAENKCKGPRFSYTAGPKPGELVVFARRVSAWERMKREL
jgi:hypothetical protein